jgi:hypothetical protein
VCADGLTTEAREGTEEHPQDSWDSVLCNLSYKSMLIAGWNLKDLLFLLV